MYARQRSLLLQVTTLLSRHDQALSQPAVSEEDLQQLQQRVSAQGSAVKDAKAAAKEGSTPEAKAQVSLLTASPHCRRSSVGKFATAFFN